VGCRYGHIRIKACVTADGTIRTPIQAYSTYASALNQARPFMTFQAKMYISGVS
jgi:hypothetical protein